MNQQSRKTIWFQKSFAYLGIFLMLISIWPPIIFNRPQKTLAADETAATPSLTADELEAQEEAENEGSPAPTADDQKKAEQLAIESNARASFNTISTQNESAAVFANINLLGQKIILDNTDRQILNSYLTPDVLAQTMGGKNINNDAYVNELFDLAESPEKIADLILDNSRNQALQAKNNQLISDKLEINNIGPDSQNACVNKEVNLCVAVVLNSIKAKLADPGSGQDAVKKTAAEISAQLKTLLESPWWQALQPVSTRLTKKDLKPLSVRTAESLVYLVTPKNLGGAGHGQIKVSIWNSPAADNAEKGSASVERHADGMAFDIEAADSVDCTVIKRRRLKDDSYIPQPAMPTKMAYQSEQGVAGSKEISDFLDSMHQTFLGTGADNLSYLLGLDANLLKNGDLGSIAMAYGVSALEESLKLPKGSITGGNTDQVIANMGKAIIADELGLPVEALNGDNTDEMEISAGQVTVEEKTQLPLGSLKGNSPDGLLSSIGRRKIEALLQLRDGSLAIDSPGQNLAKAVGQAKIEEALNVGNGTLASDNIDDFKQKLSDFRWDNIVKNGASLDEALHLPYGTTQSLFNNPGLAEYKRLAGQKALDENLLIYHKNKSKPDGSFAPHPDDSKLQESAWGISEMDWKLQLADGNTIIDIPATGAWPANSKLILATPSGVYIDRFKTGDFTVFKEIGVSELTKKLATREEEQRNLSLWLRTNGTEGSYSESVVDTRMGIEPGDFVRLFKTPPDPLLASVRVNSVFRAVGEKRFINALKKSALVEDTILGNYQNEISFYTDRVNTIKRDNAEIKQIVYNNKTAAYYTPEEKEAINQIEKAISDALKKPTINNLQAAAKNIRQALDALEARNEIRNQRQDLPKEVQDQIKRDYNQIKTDIGNINHAIREIIAGEVLSRDTNSVGGIDANKKTPKYGISYRDLINFLTGKTNRRQFLQQVGAAKLENQLALPTNSIYLFLQQNPKNRSSDSLAESIGEATVEKELALPSGSFSGNNLTEVAVKIDASTKKKDGQQRISRAFSSPGSIDDKFKLNSGITSQMLQGLISPNEYDKRVGREQEKVSVLDKLNEESGGQEILGYRMTGDDFYNILSGNNSVVLEKIGGRQLEKTMDLAPGAGLALINAKSTEERLNIIAASGFAKWAKTLGVLTSGYLTVQDFTNSKNPPTIVLGKAKVEETLGLLPDSFKGNLQSVIERNGAWQFANAFRIPTDDIVSNINIDQLTKQSEAELNILNQKIQTRVNEVLNPNSIFWQPISQPKDANERMISDFQSQITNIDLTLGLPNNQTKNLLTGQNGITPENYAQTAGQSAVNQLYASSGNNLDTLMERLGIDSNKRDAIKRVANIVKAGKPISSLTDNEKADLFNSLEWAFSQDLDEKANFRPGTIAAIIRDPTIAKERLMGEGILEIEERLGLSQNKNVTNTTDVAVAFDEHPLYTLYMGARKDGLDGAVDVGEAVVKDMVNKKIIKTLKDATTYTNKNGQVTYLLGDDNQYQQMSNDVKGSFYNGDPNFLLAVATAATASRYNAPNDQGVQPPVEMRITWDDVKHQVNNSSTVDEEVAVKAAGQAKINALKQEHEQNPNEMIIADVGGPQPWTEEWYTQQGQLAEDNVREQKNKEKYNLGWKALDLALWQKDPNIPPHFTQNLFNGNWDQSVLGYFSQKYLNDPTIGPLLEKFSHGGQDRIDAIESLKNSGFNILDNTLRDAFGAAIPFGTSEALFRAIQTNDWTNFQDLTHDLVKQLAFNFFDNALGLKEGTAEKIYKVYDAYKKFQAAKAISEAGGSGDPLLVAVMALDDALRNLFPFYDQIRGYTDDYEAFLTNPLQFGIKFALGYYAEEINKFEMDHGLVPGSIQASAEVAFTFGPAAGFAFFVVTNLVSVYRIDIYCTDNGYWLYNDPDIRQFYPGDDQDMGNFSYSDGQWYRNSISRFFGQQQTPITNSLLIAYLNQKAGMNMSQYGAPYYFDGKNKDAFKAGMIASAQRKTRQLVNDLLIAGDSVFRQNMAGLQAENENLRPTQMFSLRKEDEKYFQDQGILDRYYGPWASRVNSGFWADPKATSFIHVGY